MPLEKSSSDQAFRNNVAEMINAGHPQNQALAAAYRIKREKRAKGGAVHVGALKGDTGGRADARPIEVPANAYVIPADVVSGMGEGNTDHGMKVLEEVFGAGEGDHSQHESVPIYAADGEFVIGPEKVLEIGNGNAEQGHKELDKFVLMMRKKIIKTMSKLPGPAKD